MLRIPTVLPFAACLALAGVGVAAQERVVPVENVRTDYAQVLKVEPIYQTLRATRMDRQCEPVPAEPAASPGAISRAVRAMRGALNAGSPPQAQLQPPVDAQNCRTVPLVREFRRPIAYDVDYVYKGSKYRTRTERDPGNRLRVRVSVTPDPGD